MNTVTLDRERFQQNDIPTRLNHLAAHLAQIQSFVTNGTGEDKIVSLMRESLYFIEWTVPHYIDTDVDRSAELVDLGRILAQWLFNWEKIWADIEKRTEVAQIAGSLSERVQEVSSLAS
ncbi:hypothetical protein NIES2100_21910 [Calothrix sp. NIES-2100]|uniref:hypothetical protein n=1 Tax=Calothrix sp. NIES-2100 TaxID=1954172 RepID=UPI000B602E31|nr:hypothetical protein NIES2100_21910 [Calothrix sp. NIES-2100]